MKKSYVTLVFNFCTFPIENFYVGHIFLKIFLNIYLMIILYIILSSAGLLLSFAFIGLRGLIRAAGQFHSSMLYCVMRSPMSFFDTTPVGRIINRFSSDVDILDDRLPRTYRLFMSMFFSLLGILFVISITTPVFLAAIVPVGVLYILVLVCEIYN